MIKLCRPQMEQDYDSILQRMRNIEQMTEQWQEALASGSVTALSPSEGTAVSDPEPVKKIRPEAVPDDVRDVVANWKQILSRVGQVCRSMLVDVRLSVSDAGKLVLAFPQEVTADYFKNEEHQGELIEAAGQLTDKKISLDIRFVQTKQEMNSLPELRNIIKNVEIEMLD